MSSLFFLLFLIPCSLSSGFKFSTQAGDLTLTVTPDSSYNIQVGGSVWFNSGPTFFRGDNKTFSTEDGTLKVNNQVNISGTDSIGAYQGYQFEFLSTSGYSLTTSFRVYANSPVIVFEANFPTGVTGTSIGDPDLIASSFPTFKMDAATGTKGWATHTMFGSGHVGSWDSTTVPPGGGHGGVPLAVWDRNMSHTVILSPFSSFMAVSQAQWKTAAGSTVVGWGLVGTMTSIPKGWSYKTILSLDSSYNNAMVTWGNILLQYYGKSQDTRKSDFSINYLSYWTDNGACYYYYPGESLSYETTLIDVYKQSLELGIPYRTLQLDSWWYYKGIGDGVKNWTAMKRSDMFPHGIQYVQNATSWPITGHNRYWAIDTDYAIQNGGQWKFIIERVIDGGHDVALPTEPGFWDWLFGSTKEEWGLLVYEQDWLSTVWDNLMAIKEDVNLGRTWLLDMGASAQRLDLTIQYCMPYPRHFLQSVEVPSVTQIRVSNDYHQSNTQWIIGDSTIFAHALGLAAFKDDFRSTDVAQRCQNNDIEQWPILETVVATLSGGPVGPSDHLDNMGVDLLLKTCTKDGRILRPTYPARSLDGTFLFRSFGSDGPNGLVWDAISEVSGIVFHQIFVASLETNYNLLPNQLIQDKRTPALITPLVVYDNNTKTFFDFDSSHALTLRQCQKDDFQLYHITPRLSNNWVLLGELNKIVPVSDQRFISIEVQSNGALVLQVRGTPQEVVTISVAKPANAEYEISAFSCTFTSNEVTLKIPSGECL